MIINIDNVAARSTLAQLNMGRLSNIRKHKAETVAENVRHNVHDIARVSVKMIDNVTLKDIVNVQAAARNEHNRLTVPTCDRGGLRLLPAKRQLEHADAMRKLNDEHAKLVAQFMTEYDNEAALAPIRMNGLYDPTMWPSHAVVERKFKFNTRYLPTPTNGQWGEWLADSIEAAEAEIQERLTKALTHVRDRCKADINTRGGKNIHPSVFDAVRELADMIPDLDFGGTFQPVIDAMQPLTTVHAEFVQGSEVVREAAAAKADSIIGMLGGIK